VAEAMARIDQLGRKYGVNLQGGVTWAFTFVGQPSFAGFRELATNGVDKPVLNVFRMYGKLEGDWVNTSSSGAIGLEEMVKNGVGANSDIDAIATRSEHHVSVLAWNYSDVDLPAAAVPIRMVIDGLPGKLPKGSMKLQEFRMDDTHSNAYAAWKQMGSPERPTPEQTAVLERAAGLESLGPERIVDANDGKLVVPMLLPRDGVSLLMITW
jgi:xylan 1,4-beta-xylosidase